MASNVSNEHRNEFDEGSTPELEPSASATDEDSDEGSLFDISSNQEIGDSSSLCAHCQYICDDWTKGLENSRFVFPHWGDVRQLEDSAATCALCAQFLQSESEENVRRAKDTMMRDGPENFDTRVSVLESHDGHLILCMRIVLPLDLDIEDGSQEYHRDIIGFVVDMVPYNLSGHSYDFKDRSKQDTRCALPLASRWLKRCREAHWQCNFRREQFTPTRLVSTDENGVRLFLRDDFQSTPDYATLSHCWGQTTFVTLNRSNLDTFRKRIPEEALSKTFKDAIIVARELGLRYIWIDSLSICQDDTDDWLREAGSMSAVYGGSSLNIAASGAPNGNFGCFLRQEYVSHCRIKVRSGCRDIHYHCVPARMYCHSMSDMPLMSRGWTLQERLLPSRTLHFTSTQLFWECYQKVACETFPEQFPLSLVNDTSYLLKQPMSRSMWSWIVEQYTRTELTRVSDKLVAISGLAREIQMQTKDQYVAGMWRKDLERQLCWYKDVGQRCQRIAPYRAPTWSWASLDCPVSCAPSSHYGTALAKTFVWIEVLDVRLQFAGTDALGQLSSASLRLDCTRLLEVTIGPPQSKDRSESMKIREEKLDVIIKLDESEITKAQEAVVLPIYGDKAHRNISGLVLEPTKQQKGQYRRLGFFHLYNRRHCKTFEAAFAESSRGVEDSKLYKIRTDRHGKVHRIINLI